MGKHADKTSSVKLTGLVTSDGVARFKRGPSLVLWVGICTVVSVLVVTGVYYYQAYIQPVAHNQPAPAMTPAGTVKSAQDDVKRAVKPKDKATAYRKLGVAYLDNNQAADAATALQQSLENNQNDIPTLEALATAYQQAGKTQDAIATLTNLVPLLQVSKDPTSQNLAYRYQAEIRSLQGAQ